MNINIIIILVQFIAQIQTANITKNVLKRREEMQQVGGQFSYELEEGTPTTISEKEGETGVSPSFLLGNTVMNKSGAPVF